MIKMARRDQIKHWLCFEKKRMRTMFPQQLLSQESMLVCEYFSDGIQLNVAQALAC